MPQAWKELTSHLRNVRRDSVKRNKTLKKNQNLVVRYFDKIGFGLQTNSATMLC